MKVVQKTPTKLILQHHSGGVWVFTAICILFVPLLLLLLGATNNWLYYIWWFPLLPILSVFCGLIVVVLAGQVVTYDFDKTLNRLTIKRWSLLNTKAIENCLEDIVDIQVEPASWKSDENATYQIVIFLKGGKVMPRNLAHTSSERSQQAAVDAIREFIGLPRKQWT